MTRFKTVTAAMTAVVVLIGLAASSQDRTGEPSSSGNAALRYWMAFAQMQEAPGAGAADGRLAAALASTESGDTPWDETRLGPLLDTNRAALDTLLRASRVTRCDWELEYALGPSAPIAHLARARALARLNTLAGLRLSAQSDSSRAVDHWVAGVRFSRQIAEGGTLISTLTGWSTLRSTLGAVERTSAAGTIDAAGRQRLSDVIRALPETGFDWGMAIRNEGRVLDAWIAQLQKEGNFRRSYEQTTQRPAPSGMTPPSPADAAAFAGYIAQAADALGQPPDTASLVLPALEKSQASLHIVYRGLIPSLTRINQTRTEIKRALEETMSAL